jgi:hypothetical protein
MSNPEVKAMEEILAKMQNAQANAEHIREERAQGNVVVSESAQEMYDILAKLQNATNDSASKLVINEDVKLNDSTHNTTVGIGGSLNIVLEKQNVYGFKKTYYTITENDKPIVSSLALFESAMAIIKLKLRENKISSTKLDRIIELDTLYCTKFDEAARYKQRAKAINESAKQDVYMAKHSVAVGKMRSLKSQIKKLL